MKKRVDTRLIYPMDPKKNCIANFHIDKQWSGV